MCVLRAVASWKPDNLRHVFTAVAHKNLADAEAYFEEHLSQNDYYAAGEIRPGQWIGVGAERLGLSGAVTREQFHALCENRNPSDGERLTQRQQKEDKRRVFYDFTCSPPKSVSVLAVSLNDERLVVAHEEATSIAFRELETFAATRVRKQGNQRDRTTGNLVAARFVHTSSRELDPLLHTHCTVFNATVDDQERCWKALQARPMYDAIRYATAVYRNELAKLVQAIGYRIVPAKHGFEIEGVSDEVLERFSKRAQQRDEVVRTMEQKLGRKLSNDEISYAVHQSRAKKIKGISTAQVRERQLAQLHPDELQTLRQLAASTQPKQTSLETDCESNALAHAVAHLFERRSVVAEHELLGVALSQRPGEADLPKLKAVVDQSPALVKTERGLSTREILATELDLIQTVNAACDSVGPLNYSHTPAGWLSEDQQRAIYHVLRTGDRAGDDLHDAQAFPRVRGAVAPDGVQLQIVCREDFADGIGRVRDVNLPRIFHVLEDVVLDARLREEPGADAIVVAGRVVVIVEEMHRAPADGRHALLHILAEPIVVKGEVQLVRGDDLGVARTEQAGERVGLLGLVEKLAPRDGDVVRSAVDVQVAVLRVHERAMVHPHVARIQHAEVVIRAASDGEVADDDVAGFVEIQPAALQGGGTAVNEPRWPFSGVKPLSMTYGHTFASRGEKRKRSTPPSFVAVAGMRLSKIILAVCAFVKPAGTGTTNSTTPKTSALSASLVSRSNTVFRPSQTRTNFPPQPGCVGSCGVPCSSQPTDGESPILILPLSSVAK
jgi:conjugative relaxase-like TrwC/TraI family protein